MFVNLGLGSSIHPDPRDNSLNRALVVINSLGAGSAELRRGRTSSCIVCLAQRVHVPNNLVLGFWVIVILIQVLGKYMIIRYLDP